MSSIVPVPPKAPMPNRLPCFYCSKLAIESTMLEILIAGSPEKVCARCYYAILLNDEKTAQEADAYKRAITNRDKLKAYGSANEQEVDAAATPSASPGGADGPLDGAGSPEGTEDQLQRTDKED